jgi:hypothetical protein
MNTVVVVEVSVTKSRHTECAYYVAGTLRVPSAALNLWLPSGSVFARPEPCRFVVIEDAT